VFGNVGLGLLIFGKEVVFVEKKHMIFPTIFNPADFNVQISGAGKAFQDSILTLLSTPSRVAVRLNSSSDHFRTAY